MARTRLPASENVSALTRGFEVLECCAAAEQPLGNGDISQLTGIPRSTVSRIAATLVTLGHLRLLPGDKYELASGVVRLARAFLGQRLEIRERARPHITKVALASGCSCLLGMADGADVLVIEAAKPRGAVAALGIDVGSRMRIATSALGRAWLSGVAESVREAFLQSIEDEVSRNAARAALAAARESGIAVSLGEWHPAINAVAVPLCTASGEVYSINCGGPAFLISPEHIRSVVVPSLLEAAAAIATEIGGRFGTALTQEPATSANPESAESTATPPPAKRAARSATHKNKTPSTPEERRTSHNQGAET